MPNQAAFKVSKRKEEVQQLVAQLESMRRNSDHPVEVTLAELVQKKYGVTMDSYFEELGFNPSIDTVQNIFTMPDVSVRWLVPEIMREAIRLGLRKAAIWPSLVAMEETIKQTSATIPYINLSDAAPKYVEEGETIPLGDISYGQKDFKIRKIGRGIKTTYEVMNYCSINVVSIFLQDFGVKLGQSMDALLIDTLINGEQANGSESAPVIGVGTLNTVTYKDLLKIWIRMARIGKSPKVIIGGEEAALETLDLPEFKTNANGGTQPVGVPSSSALTLKSPIPKNSEYFIHGAVPDDQQIIVDPSTAIVKYNAQPLLVESDKIVSNQTMSTFASLTTGFGIMFRDSRVVLDKSVLFTNSGFPAYMDVDAIEQVQID